MIRAALLLTLWTVLCIAALRDAHQPYQCGSDMECETLHGSDE